LEENLSFSADSRVNVQGGEPNREFKVGPKAEVIDRPGMRSEHLSIPTNPHVVKLNRIARCPTRHSGFLELVLPKRVAAR
jgi:hypothetical protein